MPKRKKESVLVIGLGPVGGILACHLSAGGKKVEGVDIWEEHRKAIEKNGITLTGYKNLNAPLLKTYARIDEAPLASYDFVVLSVKTPFMKPIIETLARSKGTFKVVSVQNGLDNEDYIQEFLPRERILRVAVNYAGNMVKPGVIHMTFFNKPNYVGCICGKPSCKDAEHFAHLLTEVHLDTEAVPDIKRYTWEKTILNAALSPISAVLGMTMKEVMELGDTFFLVERLLTEAIEVAKKAGYDFGPGFFDYALEYLSKGGPHKPSMRVDLERGLPTEIDFINGRIVHYANRLNIPAPYNQTMTNLVKALEKKMGSDESGL